VLQGADADDQVVGPYRAELDDVLVDHAGKRLVFVDGVAPEALVVGGDVADLEDARAGPRRDLGPDDRHLDDALVPPGTVVQVDAVGVRAPGELERTSAAPSLAQPHRRAHQRIDRPGEEMTVAPAREAVGGRPAIVGGSDAGRHARLSRA